MDINKDYLEEYINRFLDAHIPQHQHISLTVEPKLLLLDNKGESVSIGTNAPVLFMLYSAFAHNKSLFKKLLFYYYWSGRNVIDYKLDGSARCMSLVWHQIERYQKKMYGYGKQFDNDGVLLYIIGHEAAHICFSIDAEYKKKAVQEVSDVFESLSETWPTASRNKLLKQALNELSVDFLSEEFACDRESLKFLFEYRLATHFPDKDTLGIVLIQLLEITMMLQYDTNMSELQTFNLRRLRYAQYITNHVGRGVLRLANAALTLHDLCDDVEFPFSYFKQAMQKQQKTLSGLATFNILDVGNAVRSESTCFDQSRQTELLQSYQNISNYIFSMLLGIE